MHLGTLGLILKYDLFEAKDLKVGDVFIHNYSKKIDEATIFWEVIKLKCDFHDNAIQLSKLVSDGNNYFTPFNCFVKKIKEK